MQWLRFTVCATGLLSAAIAVGQPAANRPAAAPPLPCEVTVDQAGWNDPAPLTALAADRADNPPMLRLGRAATIVLQPTPEMRYLLPPGQDGKADSFAGLVHFAVATAGDYRFLSSEDPWYDVIGGGSMLLPIARSHERDCIGAVRKMIDYKLSPGHYVLQISRTSTASLPLLLVKLP